MQRFTKTIAAIMLMTAMCFVAGCTKPDDSNNGGNNNGESGGNSLNGHEYVDLGLPSGTLWATCNVGAESPEEYGEYIAWGETAPKDIYDWSTYKYANGTSYDEPRLTKYCSHSSYGDNGFSDTLTILLPEDDAATVNWGNGWCMPTANQWRELYQNTIHTWTIQNGVNGRFFTSPNGNSLFLPAAGRRGFGGFGNVGSDGYYWSSTLGTDDPSRVWGFYFESVSWWLDGDFLRSYGHSVRPVRSAAKN